MKVFVTGRGDRLRYHEIYKGESPVLFIHGLGCSCSSDYPAVVMSSAYPRLKTILVDLMGAGFSDKPTDIDYSGSGLVEILTEFVNSWGDLNFSIFAHSAGALVALELAERMADRVDSLILCEPGINKYGAEFLSGIVSMTMDEFVATGFKKTVGQLSDDANDSWLGSFSIYSPYAIYQWAQSVVIEDRLAWAPKFKLLKTKQKGVIISDKTAGGDFSFFTQLECAVECVSNSTHMIMHDNPDGLAMAISNLLFNPVSELHDENFKG
ncbi:alpha/beta fold hydrolase [Pseudomonas fluorescens]|uniref:alpha/beta fold hydrolase n=1 Tax=Pseudomonas fluorescens TaxID=294 RepID=UPI000AEE7917|nr:alpha/beta hydrolase [Pseudomonas fluorescens]